jgi:hypothetical protein
MTRPLAILAFCAGLFALALSGSITAPHFKTAQAWTHGSGGGGGGCIYNAATCSWISVVKTNNGGVNPVSSTQGACVNTLTGSIITNLGPSISSVLDRLYLLANYDANAVEAAVDLINPTTSPLLVAHGTYSAFSSAGYTGNGSTFYLDTGYVPSTAGQNYTLNGASIGAGITSTGLPASNNYPIAIAGEAASIQMQAAGYASVEVNNASGSQNGAISSVQGNWVGTRTASNAYALYQNGSVFKAGSDPSGALPAYSFFIFAANNGGTPFQASPNQIQWALIGGALTGTQVSNLNPAMSTYIGCVI